MSSSLVPVPALAQRLRGVASSPVRDLLALLERPQVVSFAGGLPAPELFDLAGLRAAFDAVLATDAGRRHLQYAPTEATAACARSSPSGSPAAACRPPPRTCS